LIARAATVRPVRSGRPLRCLYASAYLLNRGNSTARRLGRRRLRALRRRAEPPVRGPPRARRAPPRHARRRPWLRKRSPDAPPARRALGGGDARNRLLRRDAREERGARGERRRLP